MHTLMSLPILLAEMGYAWIGSLRGILLGKLGRE